MFVAANHLIALRVASYAPVRVETIHSTSSRKHASVSCHPINRHMQWTKLCCRQWWELLILSVNTEVQEDTVHICDINSQILWQKYLFVLFVCFPVILKTFLKLTSVYFQVTFSPIYFFSVHLLFIYLLLCFYFEFSSLYISSLSELVGL